MTTRKKTTKKTTKKPEFSANKKLENVLQAIKDQLLHIGNTKKESISEIKHYYTSFKRQPDHNLVEYGSLLIYYGDIRDMYKKAGYGSTIDRMSDEALWNTYKRQVGYVARHLLSNNK
ncbi:MAG: hypothetical protein IJU33_02135 [Bacteroidales bacterium]|nr:hypothetical protein [Bacteroidales bacterium]